MTDKTTARGIKEWLEEEFGAEGGWRSSQVAQELSEDVVRTIRRDFTGYDRQAKLGVLFSIFQLRRSERQFMQKDLIGVCTGFFLISDPGRMGRIFVVLHLAFLGRMRI